MRIVIAPFDFSVNTKNVQAERPGAFNQWTENSISTDMIGTVTEVDDEKGFCS